MDERISSSKNKLSSEAKKKYTKIVMKTENWTYGATRLKTHRTNGNIRPQFRFIWDHKNVFLSHGLTKYENCNGFLKCVKSDGSKALEFCFRHGNSYFNEMEHISTIILSEWNLEQIIRNDGIYATKYSQLIQWFYHFKCYIWKVHLVICNETKPRKQNQKQRQECIRQYKMVQINSTTKSNKWKKSCKKCGWSQQIRS